ncbi:MAG: hypothetical protein LBG76_02535 [Treponema sp.]|jgi:hypothetical protein|nr:hypothetical protein [Treponema sp.]
MAFTDRMKDLFDQGLTASKGLASKAGAKAQELGEMGVLKFEVMQLEGQAQKLIGRLGNEVYNAFADQGAESISAESPEIKRLLEEIAGVRSAIEKREAELRVKRA